MSAWREVATIVRVIQPQPIEAAVVKSQAKEGRSDLPKCGEPGAGVDGWYRDQGRSREWVFVSTA
jgi:hypothetical protein